MGSTLYIMSLLGKLQPMDISMNKTFSFKIGMPKEVLTQVDNTSTDSSF